MPAAMSIRLSKRLKQFSRIADKAVLSKDGYFYILGQDHCDCVLVEGLMPQSVSSSRNVAIRVSPTGRKKAVERIVTEDLEKQIKRVNKLKQGEFLGSFSLSKEVKKELLKRAKDSLATHIEFESDGITARAYWFDVASTIGYSSYRSSFLAGCLGIPLPDVSGGPFSVTVHFDAFSVLPTESFVCSVYEAGFLRLLADKDGARIIIRDQDIRRPFTTFVSEMTGKDVSFLFHPREIENDYSRDSLKDF